MEVGAEAKRIMVVALGKLYSSRTQRGGLRLHKSLLLTLVMKSARDMYHAAAQLEEEEEEGTVTASCDPAQGDLHTDSETARPDECSAQGEEAAAEEEEVSEAVVIAQPEQERTEQTFTHGQTQQSRKRRGKIAAVPDFLPLKKAKLDCPQAAQQLVALVDYVTCSDLGAAPSPIPVPVPMAIAAC